MKPTRVRLTVLALLSTGTMINYLDRTVLSIAAPGIAHELQLGPATMGLIFSAFAWSYTGFQLPGGLFLDRFGARLTYFLSVSSWAVFTLLQGFSAGLKSLLVYRIGLGIAESPCFPTNSRVVATWFPRQERARATSVYTVGEYVGLAFLSPPLFWLIATYGWRAPFFVSGFAALFFAFVWWIRYREPGDDRRINRAELAYIAAGEGLAANSSRKGNFSWARTRRLLCHRQIWGAGIGQFAGNSTLVFFLTWFPTYLATARGMGWIKVGLFAVLPFMAAAVGVLAGGIFSDYLVRRTGSLNIGRKLPIVGGLVLATGIVGANYVASNAAVIAIMSIAFFGQGLVGLGWTVVSDIAPGNYAGLVGGIFNFMANFAGIITPLAIGLIVERTGSFAYALGFMASLTVIGALSYLILLGDIKRLELS